MNITRKNALKGNLLLVVTALIWGSAFVAQREGMEHIEPFTFNGVRCLIGAAVLLPFIIGRTIAKKEDKVEIHTIGNKRVPKFLMELLAGVCSGLALFIPSSLQQIGLVTTDSGKAGFITAMYVVFVPILGLFLKKRTTFNVWISVVIAIFGLYFLCITDKLTIESGDIIILIGAVFWAVQIMVIDYFSVRVDCIKLAFGQFFFCGLYSIPFMLATETVEVSNLLDCAIPLLYAGAMSCGIAYTLQPIAQKLTNPAEASLIMSLESVFAVLSGAVILGERLSERELIGCILMFAAVILAQLPVKERKRKKVAA